MIADAGLLGRRVRNTDGVLVGVVVGVQPPAAVRAYKLVVRDGKGLEFDLDPMHIAAVTADVWLKGPREGFFI